MDEWLTLQDAAGYLKLSYKTVSKLTCSNRLKSVKNGKIVRTKKIWCDEFLLGSKKRRLF